MYNRRLENAINRYIKLSGSAREIKLFVPKPNRNLLKTERYIMGREV